MLKLVTKMSKLFATYYAQTFYIIILIIQQNYF